LIKEPDDLDLFIQPLFFAEFKKSCNYPDSCGNSARADGPGGIRRT
jgi:hypothetical protein